MQLGITHPLRQFLKIRPLPPNADEDLLFCWDLHRAKMGGRMSLVLCNSATRYCAIVAMGAHDWKRWQEVGLQAIRWAMESDGFSAEMIERYFEAAGAMEVTRTHGRKPVAAMNCMIDDVYWAGWEALRDSDFQHFITYDCNHTICHCATRKDYVVPYEAFLEDVNKVVAAG